MKITLPNGTVLEPESPEEMRFVLSELGITSTSSSPARSNGGLQTASSPEVVPQAESTDTRPEPSKWTRPDAVRLFGNLADGSKRLIRLLAARDLSTNEIAKAFGYTDNRPIGGLLGGIRSNAAALNLECPVTSSEVNGERRLVLDPDFRRIFNAGKTPQIS